jgi:hypothetical protein
VNINEDVEVVFDVEDTGCDRASYKTGHTKPSYRCVGERHDGVGTADMVIYGIMLLPFVSREEIAGHQLLGIGVVVWFKSNDMEVT